MAHFYRIQSINDTSLNDPTICWHDSYRPSGIEGIYHDFRRLFEEIKAISPTCKLFRAPEIPKEYIEKIFLFELRDKSYLPDIWVNGLTALVSEKVKNIIEEQDSFEHQFYPVDVFDNNKNKINDIPYYQMNVRRYVVAEKDHGAAFPKQKFVPDYIEECFFPALLQSKSNFETISSYPIWKHKGLDSVIYISEAVLTAMREAGVTGLKEYSDEYGKAGESLVKVSD